MSTYVHAPDSDMELKNKTKRNFCHYQLRLFLPLAGILWLTIIIFAVVQHNREVAYRENYLRHQAEFINRSATTLCEDGIDINSFIAFTRDYLNRTHLEETSIAIFDNRTNERIANVGFPEMPTTTLHGEDINETMADASPFDQDKAFFYREDVTSDGRYRIQTIIPNTPLIDESVKSATWWWLLIIVCGITITIIVYLATRHLTRNVKILRKLAEAAAQDIDFVPKVNFPNDDIGEIARKITEIFTARKAAQDSREIEHRVALKATEEQNLTHRQLTNNISHELKTPIGIIGGYIETILDNPDMDADSQRHFLVKANEQITRLCTLMDDLSTMTRLDEGATKIRLEAIDFNKTVKAMVDDIEDSGIANGMKVNYDIPDNCIIKGNATMLNAALMNLVRNAANYSKGTEINIKLFAKNQRFYTFVFNDDGTGVDEVHIPHLFGRFYRVDKGRSRKAGGTGLGLPIVKQSINVMGGSITVRNRKPHGLEYVFTLPIWKKEDEDADNAEEQHSDLTP